MDIIAIGHRIKTAREQAHITQNELAKRVGVSTHYVSAMERGIKTPKLETFVAMAQVLGVSADWLLESELGSTVNILVSDVSAAMSKLPKDTQERMLRAIRAFSDE